MIVLLIPIKPSIHHTVIACSRHRALQGPRTAVMLTILAAWPTLTGDASDRMPGRLYSAMIRSVLRNPRSFNKSDTTGSVSTDTTSIRPSRKESARSLSRLLTFLLNRHQGPAATHLGIHLAQPRHINIEYRFNQSWARLFHGTLKH